jgi:CelD/BcsL family acetyltransferase involved in cellulose biosynthesis
MNTRFIDAHDEELWSAIQAHPLNSLFTSPPWIDALTRTYGFPVSASADDKNMGAGSAILFSRIRDFRGDRIVCLPFSDYCDPLVEDVGAWNELIEPILALGAPVSLRCLHHQPATADPRFKTVAHAMWHAVDLTRSEQELWDGLSGSARQNIRKARHNRVAVREENSSEAVRIFHRMHCHVRKSKYRLLAQPLSFFENLRDVFGDRLTVLLAEVDENIIAGILFIEWSGTLYYKFNASVEISLRPNDLLAWEGIRLGRRRNLARLDFGISDLTQPGLIRYKRKYATQEQLIKMLRWSPPDHADPRAEQIGRTLGRLTELLTDPTVPDEITVAAGEELYRYFC